MIDLSKVSIVFDFEGDELDDIKRCLTTLYSVKEGAQPLDRSFGINNSFLGKPMLVAQNECSLEIIEKTEIYEPRVQVNEITYQFQSSDGILVPTVILSKGVI